MACELGKRGYELCGAPVVALGASGRQTTPMKFLVTAGCPGGQRPVRPGLRGVSAPSPALVAVTAVWMGPTRSWRPRGAYPRTGVDVAGDTGRRPACVGRGDAADRRVAAAATRAEPVRASRPVPAAVCGRRGADVAEEQLTAERMGDGRAGSGRPLSWFGELAKRRTSRFGVVAALPSQLAASAAVGTEPTERDFHSCPLMLGLIGIGVFDLHPVPRGRRAEVKPGILGQGVMVGRCGCSLSR